jgi:alanyl-tRNA synthetase
LRVIADHIRACSFLIVDGVLPSNEGRGYVLRRIIRRALRHGWMLGVRGDFFWKMVQPLVEEMGEAYPELAAKQAFVEDALRTEEQRFGETLEHGMRVFDEVAANRARPFLAPTRSVSTTPTVFPVDLTADIARERGWKSTWTASNKAMNEQRERARAAGRFEAKGSDAGRSGQPVKPTEFLGYDALRSQASKVLGIVRDGKQVDRAWRRRGGLLILDRTPFYAESGGQVGDTGELINPPGLRCARHAEDGRRVLRSRWPLARRAAAAHR